MVTLSEEDRVAIHANLMRREPSEAWPVTKADLKAAVDAADTWIDDNAASFNTALPEAFRTAASAAQKALLLMAVAAARFGVI